MDVKQSVESRSSVDNGYIATNHSTVNIKGRNVQLGEKNRPVSYSRPLSERPVPLVYSTQLSERPVPVACSTPLSERPVPERKVSRKMTRKRIYDELENDNAPKLVVDISSPGGSSVQYKPMRDLRKKLFGDDNVGTENCPPKVECGSEDMASENEDLMPTENTCKLDLGRDCFVVARRFRGEIQIHVRFYGRRCDGSTFPTKRGIALSLQRWKKLELAVPDVDRCISEMLEGKTVNYRCHLGGNYHVSFKTGFPCVDMHSWFKPENSDSICATRKGIALTYGQFERLKGAMVVVREFLGKELDDIVFCEYSDDHQNQEGALRCRECNPCGYLNYQD